MFLIVTSLICWNIKSRQTEFVHKAPGSLRRSFAAGHPVLIIFSKMGLAKETAFEYNE